MFDLAAPEVRRSIPPFARSDVVNDGVDVRSERRRAIDDDVVFVRDLVDRVEARSLLAVRLPACVGDRRWLGGAGVEVAADGVLVGDDFDEQAWDAPLAGEREYVTP